MNLRLRILRLLDLGHYRKSLVAKEALTIRILEDRLAPEVIGTQ